MRYNFCILAVNEKGYKWNREFGATLKTPTVVDREKGVVYYFIKRPDNMRNENVVVNDYVIVYMDEECFERILPPDILRQIMCDDDK